MVDVVFLPQILGPWWGPMIDFLPFYECRWGCACTSWWWEHLKTTLCNWTYLKFLSSSMVKTQKPSLDYPHTPSHILAHPHTPLHILVHPCTSSHPLHTQGIKSQDVQGCATLCMCKDVPAVQGCVRVCKGVQGCASCARVCTHTHPCMTAVQGCARMCKGGEDVQGCVMIHQVCKDVQDCARVCKAV